MKIQWRGRKTVFLAAIALLLAPPVLLAQGFPGGGMGSHGGGRGGHTNGNRGTAPDKKDVASVHAINPLRAMLGEMPKLRADLLLTAPQLEKWSSMEDAMRSCADLEPAPLAHAAAAGVTDPGQFVQGVAADEQALAEATSKLAAAMKAAFAALNPRQLKLSQDRLAAAIDHAAQGGLNSSPGS
jgi:hypothetical protein